MQQSFDAMPRNNSAASADLVADCALHLEGMTVILEVSDT